MIDFVCELQSEMKGNGLIRVVYACRKYRYVTQGTISVHKLRLVPNHDSQFESLLVFFAQCVFRCCLQLNVLGSG